MTVGDAQQVLEYPLNVSLIRLLKGLLQILDVKLLVGQTEATQPSWLKNAPQGAIEAKQRLREEANHLAQAVPAEQTTLSAMFADADSAGEQILAEVGRTTEFYNTLNEVRSQIAASLVEAEMDGDVLLTRIDELAKGHGDLEERIALYLVLPRPHLSAEQRTHLSELCGDAGGVRRANLIWCPPTDSENIAAGLSPWLALRDSL